MSHLFMILKQKYNDTILKFGEITIPLSENSSIYIVPSKDRLKYYVFKDKKLIQECLKIEEIIKVVDSMKTIYKNVNK